MSIQRLWLICFIIAYSILTENSFYVNSPWFVQLLQIVAYWIVFDLWFTTAYQIIPTKDKKDEPQE